MVKALLLSQRPTPTTMCLKESVLARLPDLDVETPVIILKAGRDPINHGGLGIARSVGRLGVPVFAIVEDADTPLARSRYVQEAFVWKGWPVDDDAFVQAISAIGTSIGRPSILFPIDDLAAIFVAENASRLVPRFLLPKLSPTLPRQIANKASFYELCNQIGLPCPRSIIPKSEDDVRRFVLKTGFPVVIKAAEQWNTVSYKLTTVVVHDWETLCALFCRQVHSAIILQEYINGDDWIYNGYSNFGKELHLGFTGKRLLAHPKGTGSTAIAVSLRNPTVYDQAQRLLRAIRYSGVCDLDWRRDSRDGQYKILDCNPRIGLNFQIFENTAGIDVARALHLDLTGREVQQGPMVRQLFVVEHLYLRSIIRDGRRGAPANVAASAFQIRKRLAWWSINDPLPFFAMIIRVLLAAIARRLIRFGQELISSRARETPL